MGFYPFRGPDASFYAKAIVSNYPALRDWKLREKRSNALRNKLARIFKGKVAGIDKV